MLKLMFCSWIIYRCIRSVVADAYFLVISKAFMFLFTSRSSFVFHIPLSSCLSFALFFCNPLHSYNTIADCNCLQSCSGSLFIIWSRRTRDNVMASASWHPTIQELQIADCHVNYSHNYNVNKGGCTRRVNLTSRVIIFFVICNNESLDCWECKWALHLETKHEHAF